MAISIKVIIDREQSFFGQETDLSNDDVNRYLAFAALISLWFAYELLGSIRFFAERMKQRGA